MAERWEDKGMGYAELVAKLQSLPADKQAEVFDFVDFLALRCAPKEKNGKESPWSDADFSAFALKNALADQEDDPVVYDHKDLRERW
jgi:hypothetical protein